MIEIHLDGFYKKPEQLPSVSGIYVVYACRYNQFRDVIESARIIYIGKSDNLRERHYKDGQYCHEHFYDFSNECLAGETVFYCYAPVDGRSLDKVENALIAVQQPPLNFDCKNSYNHGADYFKIRGAGSDDFRLREFGFSNDYDIRSLYTEGDIEFE